MHRGDADGSRTAVGPVWSWKMGSDFGLRRSGLELACFDLATTSPTKGASLGTGVAWKKAGHAQAGKDIQFQELPAWDAFDRHVLRFSGYFKEPSLWDRRSSYFGFRWKWLHLLFTGPIGRLGNGLQLSLVKMCVGNGLQHCDYEHEYNKTLEASKTPQTRKRT